MDVVLLSFILRGTGTHYLGNKAYPKKGPSLSITHYGQVHDIVTDRNGIDVVNIYLNLDRYPLPEMPAELREVLPQILPLHPNFYRTPGHMTRIEFDSGSPVVALARLMVDEFRGRKPGREALTRDYFRLFLAECCRQVLKSGLVIRGTGRPRSYEIMEPVRQFVDLHYTDPLSMAALARRSGYSIPHLCKTFKEYTGKTVFGYILDKRLQQAMLQLKHTDKRISGIAYASGFSDLSFFNKLFKKTVGMTPGAYRGRKV